MLTADGLRLLGWSVAVHNDYRQNGERFTFWLFTKRDRCAKGEGRTDDDALAQVTTEVERIESEWDRQHDSGAPA